MIHAQVNEAVVRGADAYTFRPVSIGELKAAMERAFQAHKQQSFMR
ncbi:MAG: hypothetical protein Q7U34_15825 [Anaerolineales bacterium]|nr:hypothetical protein [Anaerolineales bacterium]MDP3186622.1 hypothetical protein [Anaerolineales bacterium]